MERDKNDERFERRPYGIGFSKASINQSARNSGQTDGNVQHFHGGCGRVIRLKINSIHSTSGILSLSVSLSLSVFGVFSISSRRSTRKSKRQFAFHPGLYEPCL